MPERPREPGCAAGAWPRRELVLWEWQAGASVLVGSGVTGHTGYVESKLLGTLKRLAFGVLRSPCAEGENINMVMAAQSNQ